MAGKPGRTGTNQKGNMNALRNGGQVDWKRLVVGELPSTMASVKREGRAYRRDLEREVLGSKGEINTTSAHLIDTATAATTWAGVCRWLLRNKLPTMSVADIRGCSQDITRAKQMRDAAVKSLQLDAAPADFWTPEGTTHEDLT